jgi:catabolite regulation protein CreA
MKCFNLMRKTRVVGGVGIAIASLLGSMVLAAQPAQAGSLGEDAAVGAGVGLGTGLILGDDFGVDDAANGAAAGVACHVANEELHEEDERNLAEDLAIGAVTAGGVGLITNNDSILENAVQGAAACGTIHVLD